MVNDVVSAALDGYRIDGELGRGAMGEVLAGHHIRLGRSVAIKRLPAGFAADPEVRSRFGAEAQVLASLDHPHIVPVYDYVESDGLCLLVMQALPGGTVWDAFRADGLTMPSACAVALATCAGLAHAHDRKVLHRDIKPENLMFDEQRTLKVTDFGIATVLSGSGTLATAGGEVIGTPAYMAPEQADGSPVGPAADVYAVATMLYELLSGRLPFSEDGGALELLQRRLEEDPIPLVDVAASVPAPVAAAVMAGLQRSSSERPGSAQDMGIEIGRAAVSAWGPRWLERADIQLLATGPLAVAATTVRTTGTGATTAPGGAAPGASGGRSHSGNETVLPGHQRSVTERADDTVAPVAPTAPVAPVAPVVPAPAAPEPPTDPAVGVGPPEPSVADAAVRPAGGGAPRAGGPDLSELAPDDLVPVGRAVARPPSPWSSGTIALVLCAAAVLLGLSGVLGTSADVGAPTPAIVSVAGVDPAVVQPVPVDLDEPVDIVLAPGPPPGSTAQLELYVGGLPVGSSEQAALVGPAEAPSATVSASSARFVAGGPLGADVVIRSDAGVELGRTSVVLQPDRPWFLSIGGWLTLLITAGAIGYARAWSRPLRRGRRRWSARIGLTASGAVLGAAMVLWGWNLRVAQPSAQAIAVGALLGGIGFAFGAVALLAHGRRRRLRRRRRARDRARA